MSETTPYVVTLRTVVPDAAQAAAANTPIGVVPFAGVITRVSYVADTLLTGANSNTRRVSLVNRGQTGAGSTEAAALQFNSGVDAAAFDETAITLSATAVNRNVAAGDVLAWASAAVGSGLADPGGLVQVEISRS